MPLSISSSDACLLLNLSSPRALRPWLQRAVASQLLPTQLRYDSIRYSVIRRIALALRQKEEIKRIDDDKAWEIAMRYEVSELPLLLPPEPIATMEQGEFFENFDNMRIEMKTLLARVEALESQIKNLKT